MLNVQVIIHLYETLLIDTVLDDFKQALYFHVERTPKVFRLG